MYEANKKTNIFKLLRSKLNLKLLKKYIISTGRK